MIDRPRSLMVDIEPLGTGVLLPAIVIGVERSANDDEALRRIASGPPWIVQLSQQAGGYCMRYPKIVGCVLRLASNKSKGKSDLAPLLRGFELMAEDPQVFLLSRDYPQLRDLVRTSGQDYTKGELSRLYAFLADYLSLPALDWGFEAYVRFEECDLLKRFGGWQIMSCTIRDPAGRRGSIYAMNQDFMYYADTVGDFALDDSEVLTTAHLGRIESACRSIEPGCTLRAYLLWENSD